MKLLRILMLAVMLPVGLWAQDVKINEGTAKMGKTKLWCFNARYAYAKNITVDVMEQNIANANIKRSSRKKGFSIYKGVSWAAISNSKGDYYYKAKSKKGKTTVYFCASKGYDNYVTSANDVEISGNIKRFLQNLDGQIATAVSIKEKEAELKNIEQKNAEINKQLEASKKEQAEKTKQIEQLKKVQTAQPAAK